MIDMKRIFAIIALSIVFLSASAQRPKVGVVLCGGGAKGAAHIGVLKVLEENNIPIDYIAGTSMGAIIGGLYAVGYTADELDSLILAQDWDFIMRDQVLRKDVDFEQRQFSDKYILKIPFGNHDFARLSSKRPSMLDNIPMALVKGHNVYNLFTKMTVGYQDSIDFNRMPIPFACVAVDIAGKKEYVFHSGSIVEAMRASMAIPGYFAPVRKNGMVLCDGGLLNNFPVDVVKEMGADIVIGVKLGGFNPTPKDVNNIGDVANEMMDLFMDGKLAKAVSDCNILITPDVAGYTPLSFETESLAILVANGKKAAEEKKDALVRLRASLQEEEEAFIGPSAKPVEKLRKAVYLDKDTVRISSVQVNGLKPKDAMLLMRRSKFTPGAKLTGQTIEEEIDNLYSTGAFDAVSYSLTGEEEPYHMTLNFDPGPRSQLGLGMRVDSEEIAAILINIGFNEKALYGHKWSVSAKLAYNLQMEARYNYAFKSVAYFDAGYRFRNSTLNLLKKYSRSSYAFQQHSVWLGFATNKTKLTKTNFGAQLDYFSSLSHFGEMITTYDDDLSRNLFLRGYFNFALDRFDREYFPTRGIKFTADYNYFFNRLFNEKNDFMMAHARFSFAAPMGKRFALLGTVENRTLIGNDVPLAFMNIMGGAEVGRYMDQQMTFIGYNYSRSFKNFLTTATLDLRYRMFEHHYFFLSGAWARDAQVINDFFENRPLLGSRIGYSYDSVIGPLSIDINWSNVTKVGVYLSLGYSF